MRVAIFNFKGGTGKSTLTSHVGFRASEKNMNFTVFDTDRQRNTMSWLSNHTNTLTPFMLNSVRVTYDVMEMESNCIIDCPPSYSVVEEWSGKVDTWLVPVDSRFAADGLMTLLSQLKNERIVVVVNKALSNALGSEEISQIKQVEAELYKFPIPMHDTVRRAEMLGVPAWKVPYGIRSSATQHLQMFADWVLSGCSSIGTYSGAEKDKLNYTRRGYVR